MSADRSPATLIYLNNAAQGYPTSPAAIATFNSVISSPPSGARQLSRSRVEDARTLAAQLLGRDRSQIVFCASATNGINQAIAGYLQPGDHCIVDNRSHNAVLRTVANLPHVTFDIARIYDSGETMHIQELLCRIGPHTRLVCLNHVSNVTGSVYGIARVIETLRATRPDIACLVDASQAVGLVDLGDALRADFVVFGCQKYLHGIPGAAILVRGRPLRPLLFGGTGAHSSILSIDELPEPPLEVGTVNEAAICALVKCLENAFRDLHQRRDLNRELTAHLCAEIETIEEFQLIGRPSGDDRIGVVAVRPTVGNPQLDWAPYLASQGIVVRGGLHCAPTLHEECGLLAGGTLRISLGLYNTLADIDCLVAAAKEYLVALRELDLATEGAGDAD
jgi:selenocysteine lyase/cysteine desulfurase